MALAERDIPLYILDFINLDPVIQWIFYIDPSSLPHEDGRPYDEVIEKKMFVQKVQENLSAGKYESLEAYYQDLYLIFSNAMKFNSASTYFWYEANWLKEHLDRLIMYGNSIVRSVKENKISLNGILLHLENHENANLFKDRVKDSNYCKATPKQMNLSMIRKQINSYANTEELLRDFRLILSNCLSYNHPPHSDYPSASLFSKPCLAFVNEFYRCYFQNFLKIPVPKSPPSILLPNYRPSVLKEDIVPERKKSISEPAILEKKLTIDGIKDKPSDVTILEKRKQMESTEDMGEASLKIKFRKVESQAPVVEPALEKFTISIPKRPIQIQTLVAPLLAASVSQASLQATASPSISEKDRFKISIPKPPPIVSRPVIPVVAAVVAPKPVQKVVPNPLPKINKTIFNADFVSKTLDWIQQSDPTQLLSRTISQCAPNITPSISLYRNYYIQFLSELYSPNWFEDFGRNGTARNIGSVSVDSIRKKFLVQQKVTKSTIAFAHDVRRLLSVSLTRNTNSDEYKLASRISREFEAKFMQEQCVQILHLLQKQFPHSYWNDLTGSFYAPLEHLDNVLPEVPTDSNVLLNSSVVKSSIFLGLDDLFGSFAYPLVSKPSDYSGREEYKWDLIQELYNQRDRIRPSSEVNNKNLEQEKRNSQLAPVDMNPSSPLRSQVSSLIDTVNDENDVGDNAEIDIMNVSETQEIPNSAMENFDDLDTVTEKNLNENEIDAVSVHQSSTVGGTQETGIDEEINIMDDSGSEDEVISQSECVSIKPEEIVEKNSAASNVVHKRFIAGLKEIEENLQALATTIISGPSSVNSFLFPSQFVLAVRKLLFYRALTSSVDQNIAFREGTAICKSLPIRVEFDLIVEEHLVAASPLYLHPILRDPLIRNPLLFRCRKAYDLLKIKMDQKNSVFLSFYKPVHPCDFSLLDYFSIVDKPADLSTCQRQLQRGFFLTEDIFVAAIKQSFENCKRYHTDRPATMYLVPQAESAAEKFDGIWSKITSDFPASKITEDPIKTKLALVYDETVTDDIYCLKSLIPKLHIADVVQKPGAELDAFAFLPFLVRSFPEFSSPVDTKVYPSYLTYIKHPMDLSKLRRKLNNGVYSTLEEFEADMKLIESNCVTFNPDENSLIRLKCADMMKRFGELFEECKSSSRSLQFLEFKKAQAVRRAVIPSKPAPAFKREKVAHSHPVKKSTSSSKHPITVFDNATSRGSKPARSIFKPLNYKYEESENEKMVRQSLVESRKITAVLNENVRNTNLELVNQSWLAQPDFVIPIGDCFRKFAKSLESNSNKMDVEEKELFVSIEKDIICDISRLNSKSMLIDHVKSNNSVVISLVLPCYDRDSLPAIITPGLMKRMQLLKSIPMASYSVYRDSRESTIPKSNLFPNDIFYTQITCFALKNDLLNQSTCAVSDDLLVKLNLAWNLWYSDIFEDSLGWKNSPHKVHPIYNTTRNLISFDETLFIPPSVSSSKKYVDFSNWLGCLNASKNESSLKSVEFNVLKLCSQYDVDLYELHRDEPIQYLQWNERGYYAAITASSIEYLPTITLHLFTLSKLLQD